MDDETPDIETPVSALLRALDLYRDRVQSGADATTTAEREEILEQLSADIKEDYPEIFQGLVEGNKRGIFLFLRFFQALDYICDRKDLSPADREEIDSDAHEFMSIFRAVSDSSAGICPRELVWRFGAAALSLGLSVGLSPDKVLAWKQKGGKNSVVTRRAKRQRWLTHAKELAIAAYARNPAASDDTIAVEIASSWKLAEVNHPGHRTLCAVVSDLRKRGFLQRT